MKKIVLTLQFLLGVILSAHAGSPKMDSLKKSLKVVSHDTSRIKTFLSISQEYLSVEDFAEALRAAENAWKIADDFNDKSWKSKTLLKIGNVYDFQSNPQKASAFYLKAIQENGLPSAKVSQIYRRIGYLSGVAGNKIKEKEYYLKALEIGTKTNDPVEITSSWLQLGNVSLDMADFPAALQYYLKALRTSEQTKDSTLMYKSLTNIAAVYEQSGDYERALNYYFKVLKLHTTDEDLSITCYNIGSVYFNLGKYEMSLQYMKKALSYQIKGNYQEDMSDTYAFIAKIYIKLNDLSNASHYADEGLKFARQFEYPRGISISYQVLAEILLKRNQPARAVDFGKRAVEIAKEAEDHLLVKDGYDLIAQACYKSGNFKEAYQYSRLLHEQSQSLFNQEQAKAVAEMQSRFEAERKDKEIALLNEEKAIQSLELIRQAQKRNIYIGSISLLFVTSVFFINRSRLKQKARTQEQLNQKQKELAVAVMQSQEQERKRIAEDLHDSLGQLISTVKYNMQTFPSDEKVRNTLGLLEHASQEIHNITFNLMPKALEEAGLIAALQDLVLKVNASGRLSVDLHLHGLEDSRLEKQTEFNVFRIIQEAVNNILKHAEAKEITIQLILKNNHLTIMIEDDGKGFDTKVLKEGRGLRNIHTRSSWLKGNLSIDSSPGRGTTVTTEIPL